MSTIEKLKEPFINLYKKITQTNMGTNLWDSMIKNILPNNFHQHPTAIIDGLSIPPPQDLRKRKEYII